MGNTRHVTVNSVAATELFTSVECADVFIGEDPAVSGSSFPSTGLLVVKNNGAQRGIPPGMAYQFSSRTQTPAPGQNNYPGPWPYPAGYFLGTVQALAGSITLFIDEEG
jgi:hypothetical protein